MNERTPDHPDENDPELDLRMAEAIREVMAAILIAAIRNQVCPVCLTDIVAATVESSVEAGRVSHGVPSGPEPDLEDMPTFGGVQ